MKGVKNAISHAVTEVRALPSMLSVLAALQVKGQVSWYAVMLCQKKKKKDRPVSHQEGMV